MMQGKSDANTMEGTMLSAIESDCWPRWPTITFNHSHPGWSGPSPVEMGANRTPRPKQNQQSRLHGVSGNCVSPPDDSTGRGPGRQPVISGRSYRLQTGSPPDYTMP